MLYSKRRNLEDRIVEEAVTSAFSVKSLHEHLNVEDPGLSLRAVYSAVSHLVGAGVLIKVGKVVRLNREWVKGLREAILLPVSPPVSAGERLVYTFASIEHLDAFWKTMAFQLEEYERDGDVFFYNPHNFWAYIPERKESEDLYYQHFLKAKRHGFFTVGGNSTADAEFKRAYQNEYLQIDIRDIPALSRRDHITIMGNFIITVRISKELAGRVDALYASERPVAEITSAVISACNLPSTTRFILENNPKKARKLKKTLALNFYFKRPE